MENHNCNKTAKQQGNHAENFVNKYLQNAGLILLTRNFTCKFGEIDLVMREDDTIVFVEVRYRQTQHYGSAIESITKAKQNRIRRAAQFYLQKYDPNEGFFWRYDWVGVSPSPRGRYKVEWIKNAWEEDY